MIASDGSIKLIDFGISRIYKNDQQHDTIAFGSNGYAAPEQYGKAQSCTQTDIYGLGATMYFMATGKVPPYCIGSVDDIRGHKLEGIIKKAVQVDVNHRYPGIDEMKVHINRVFKETTRTTVMGMKNTMDKTKKMMTGDSPLKEGPIKASTMKRMGIKGKAGKILAGLIIILLVMLPVDYFMMSRDKNSDTAFGKTVDSNNTAGQDNTEGVQPQGTPAETNHIEDSSTEGTIDLSRPTVLGSNYVYKPNSKGKAKGKNKQAYYGTSQEDLLYKANPEASAVKYDGKFQINLVSIEKNGDDLIARCSVLNNTGRAVGISIKDTYMFNDQVEYVRADESQSTDISQIPSSPSSKNAAFVFKGFGLDTNLLVMSAKTVSQDPTYSGGEIQLTVNVK
jgi:serine/threonine protein kinase